MLIYILIYILIYTYIYYMFTILYNYMYTSRGVQLEVARGMVRAGLAVSKLMDLVVPTFKQVQLAGRACLACTVFARP